MCTFNLFNILYIIIRSIFRLWGVQCSAFSVQRLVLVDHILQIAYNVPYKNTFARYFVCRSGSGSSPDYGVFELWDVSRVVVYYYFAVVVGVGHPLISTINGASCSSKYNRHEHIINAQTIFSPAIINLLPAYVLVWISYFALHLTNFWYKWTHRELNAIDVLFIFFFVRFVFKTSVRFNGNIVCEHEFRWQYDQLETHSLC